MTSGLVLGYVRSQAGDEAVRQVLARAGAACGADLENDDGRIPYDVKVRLFEAAAAVLDDPAAGRRIGASVLDQSVGAHLKLLVRSFGSPEMVLRNVSRISTRFDTAAVFRTEQVTPGLAVLAWRVLEPHRASGMDCDYNIGLLTQTTVLFGLPPAQVRHPECQLDGAAECRYEVRWRPQRRGLTRLRRAARHRDGLVAIGRQIALLQEAADELVADDDLATVLDRIAERAGEAVHAPGHLLAVTLEDGSHHVRGAGTAAEQTDLAERLLRGDIPPSSLAVDVRSARRHYGVLAAVAVPGQAFFDNDRDMLAAYARYAAAALDMAGAVGEARCQERTSRLLLRLAGSLGQSRTSEAVARSVADAVPELVGCERASVTLWDEAAGTMSVAAATGWPPELRENVENFLLTPEGAPEFAAMLADPQPVFLDGTGSSWSRDLLRVRDASALAAVPITVDGRLIGVVSGHWSESDAPAGLTAGLTERLTGLAHQAAVALQNVQLLQEVRHQALHDPLTGLPNRTLLELRLQAALRAAARSGRRVGVLFCDLNRFKRINDGLGHGAGDELLRQVGRRLTVCLRDTDTAARYNGNEFVVLLPGLGAPEDVQVLAERVEEALALPFEVAGAQVFADAALGMAVSDGFQDPAVGVDLVRCAEREMAAAKARTRGCSLRMTGRDRERLSLEADLHKAVERNELRLHYQPQFDLMTEQVVGTEALVRWQHPGRGLVSPAEFIPLAEETGLISEIGEWVLREACTTGAAWRRRGFPLTLSVNVSAPQLQDPGFARRVAGLLKQTGLPPAALILEITESQAVADVDATHAQLRQLREIGLGVAIDDFGTGYSSLAQLRRLPVTEVKIDKSFVAELQRDPQSHTFLEGMVGLARGLRLDMVAEGVETSAQLEVLTGMRCSRAQGYLLARPLEGGDFLRFLSNRVVAHGLVA